MSNRDIIRDAEHKAADRTQVAERKTQNGEVQRVGDGLVHQFVRMVM